MPEACADETSRSTQAVQLGHEALSLYEAGEWKKALILFEQAHQRAFSPVFMLYMARCHRELGSLREAVALLEQVTTLKSDASVPATWTNAIRDARAELGPLRYRMPSLRVTGDGLVAVKVDGEDASLDSAIDLNPGRHAIAVEHKTHGTLRRSVELSEGQQGVVIDFTSETAKPLPRKAGPAPAAPIDTPPQGPRRSRKAAWLAGGVGLAAAVVGGVAGAVAASKTASIRSRCDGNHCPPELEPQAERARIFANVSTAAFGIAGANAAVSITLFLLPE